MIDMLSRIVGAGLMAVLLAGCSSEKRTDTSLPLKVVGALKSRTSGPVPKIQLTAEQLAQVNVPVIQINPEIFGGSDFLRLAASRRDSGMGVVQVWKSSDNAQIFLRNGVVVGSRGVGGDMISANARTTIGALGAQVERSGQRTYVISDGDVTATEYKFNCSLRKVGSENITVVNQSIETLRMREDCEGGPDGTAVLRNDYWVQKSNGAIRKSRQWIGPRVGYFEVILLKS